MSWKKKFLLYNDSVPILALCLSPLFITTWINLDPINLPRLLLISSLAALAVFILIRDLRTQEIGQFPRDLAIFLIIAGLLIVSILNAWFFSGANLTRQFYGQFGRNNGVLAYVGLTILLISAVFARRWNRGKALMFAISLGGIVNLIYGYIQFFGLDPIEWQNAYGPIVGTLGNPNFMSSYLGLFGTYVASRVISNSEIFGWLRVLNGALLLMILFLIWRTDSIQGIFVVLSGTFVLIMIKLRLLQTAWRVILLLFFGSIASVILIGGFIGKGPLGTSLYQSTFEVRTFFWSAAISMMSTNPFHGLGMDTFGDWYRAFRSESSTQFSGDINTDSAHSVALDFAAWGGLPMFTAWILLIVFVFWQSIKHFRRNSNVDSDYAFLFSAWVGYVMQSFVSINQLTLATYGFVITGLLLSRTIWAPAVESKSTMPIRGVNWSGAIALLAGASLVLPALRADAKFREALLAQEGTRIIAAAKDWPKNDTYMVFAAELLSRNGYNLEASDLSREAIKVNPQNLRAWKVIFNSSTTSVAEKKRARQELERLDPWLWPSEVKD